MSQRKAPTIEDGILHSVHHMNDVIFVSYAPGNGYRYDLIFTRLRADQCGALGTTFPSMLATVVNFNCAMVIPCNEKYLAASYVAEKTRLSEEHAGTLAEILAHVTGRSASGPGSKSL